MNSDIEFGGIVNMKKDSVNLRYNTIIIHCVAVFMMIILCLCTLTCCDINKPLRNHMLSYYSDDSNYQTVVGVVLSNDGSGTLQVQVGDEYSDFIHHQDRIEYFKIYSNLECLSQINVGDEITFISAPMCFYNGQDFPIVELTKDNVQYIPFIEGKAKLIEWVQGL